MMEFDASNDSHTSAPPMSSKNDFPVKKVILPLAFLLVIVLAFMFWPKSLNRQYVELSKEYVKINNNWAQIPQTFCEKQSDGSLIFPASYVVFEKKDSIENVKRGAYLNEQGDSVPYVYNKKEIIINRAIITPGSNQIKIRSKDYIQKEGYIYIKPELFQTQPKTIRFFETPAAKIDTMTKKTEGNNTYLYILGIIIIAGIAAWWFFFRETKPDIISELRTMGIDIPDEELEHYIIPDYSAEEIAYLINIYKSKAKALGFSYSQVMKKAIPIPLQNIIGDLQKEDDMQVNMMKKAAEIDRKRFEKSLDEYSEIKKINPNITYEAALQMKNKNTTIGAFDSVDLPMELLFSFKNLNSYKFHMKNIENLGHDIDLKSRLHKYENPADIEKLVESFYNLLKADVDISFDDLEKHYLNGGNTQKLELSLIQLKTAGMKVDFKHLINIDLSGMDLAEVVPKAIKPAMKKLHYEEIIAPDKEILQIEAELTYRVDLSTYLSTAGLDTLVARIDEAMHDVIGNMGTSQKAIKNPISITNEIIKMGLDKDISLSIVSLNITSIKLKKEEKKSHRRHDGFHGSY